MRYNNNDKVMIVKSGDKYEGKYGTITEFLNMTHVSVTAYYVTFDDNRKKYYFFSELSK